MSLQHYEIKECFKGTQGRTDCKGGLSASNGISKSLHATSRYSLSICGRPCLDCMAALGQTKSNNNIGQAIRTMDTG